MEKTQHGKEMALKNRLWNGLKKRTGLLLASVITLGFIIAISAQAAIPGSSSWKIGRAVITGSGNQQVLKLSLRNHGKPSKEAVSIKGRWGEGAPGKRVFKKEDLTNLSLLGEYQKEVELKQTAILEISLSPIGPPAEKASVLELAILTGKEASDGQAIAIY